MLALITSAFVGEYQNLRLAKCRRWTSMGPIRPMGPMRIACRAGLVGCQKRRATLPGEGGSPINGVRLVRSTGVLAGSWRESGSSFTTPGRRGSSPESRNLSDLSGDDLYPR